MGGLWSQDVCVGVSSAALSAYLLYWMKIKDLIFLFGTGIFMKVKMHLGGVVYFLKTGGIAEMPRSQGNGWIRYFSTNTYQIIQVMT